MTVGRPGPKPKRIYLRWARSAGTVGEKVPTGHSVHQFRRELERVGRLIAGGRTTEPEGDLLLFRAVDRREAGRVLRTDPWRTVEGAPWEIIEWDAQSLGDGVNLDLAPARGSGRLTALDRVAVVVRRQDAAHAWYEDVLGLRVRSADPDTGYLELALGQGAVGLFLVEPRPAWGEPFYSEAVARIGKATGIVFETDSVRALELRLRHAGARVTQSATPQPWGGATVRFCDPDGNEFLAFQDGRWSDAGTTPEPGTAVPVRPTRKRTASATQPR
jgi:catechol 2,3-dioxygenase-like lactoylglutathione lyase family enzyme